MLVDVIAGARPNFMKVTPIIEQIRAFKAAGHNINYRLVHTGQHYDHNMSESFFRQLNIPMPDINLEVGSGSQGEQAGNIIIKYEQVLLDKPADLTLVVGDVTSTMACSIAAKKLQIKIAHVEGGIRSFDLSMPEEINRMVTDSITDYFFTTSHTANQNLLKSGIDEKNIFFVGNTMIDTLLKNMNRLSKPAIFDELQLQEREYFVLTLHRPNNVDEGDNLKRLISEIVINVNGLPIIFPVHPRTAKNLASLGINHPNLYYTEPMGYLEFNYMVKNAKAVITDSGGITEETTVMAVPCITLRNNTERPETVTVGTNELVGTNPDAIKPALEKLFSGQWKKGAVPELWDGKTSERIVAAICRLFGV